MMAKLKFYGGAGTVTGANFMFEVGDGDSRTKLLIDCGILQARGAYAYNKKFDYDPKIVDILIITHAHADHIGKIPKLVKDGFRGVIYSTPATRDLVEPLFNDALKIMETEKREKKYTPLYAKKDVTQALSQWKTIGYYKDFSVGDMNIRLLDSGHVLGSAMVEIVRSSKKFVFTGDLGNSPAPLLRDTDKLENVDYLLMESVYGDRNHEERAQRVEKLATALVRTKKRGGTLLIPAFSMQRTQILLYEINKLVESGKISEIPVYLDSPLAIKITEIYKKYTHLFNDKAKEEIKAGDDIFDFPKFNIVRSAKASQVIMKIQGPKVIIAGSGMSVGGRILAHEKHFLSDKNNAILFVGYQSAHTLGREIQEKNTFVKIDKERVRVRAHIDTISGFSAHKDSDHLVEFVSYTADTLKKVFVTMGEPKSSLFLAQRLHDYLDIQTVVPKENQEIDIDF